MFLHIGADTEVLVRDIVTILNISSATKSKITREFIEIAEEEEFTRYISDDTPKSIIIVYEKDKYILYFSPINSTTLQNRLSSPDNINYWKK